MLGTGARRSREAAAEEDPFRQLAAQVLTDRVKGGQIEYGYTLPEDEGGEMIAI